MAINKAMRAALKALSYPDIDLKKNYKLVRMAENVSHPPANKLFYKAWDHVVPCGDHEVAVRIFAPRDSLPQTKILLFFHGGGWVTGNIDSYDKTCHVMANKTGRTVVSVDYRLAPEYPFPAGLEDCYAVAREIFLDDTLLGTHADEITLIGDSAGGNLAAAVSLLARDRGEFLPRQQILIYPATYNDHTDASPFPSVRSNGSDYLLTAKRVNDYMELYMVPARGPAGPLFCPAAGGGPDAAAGHFDLHRRVLPPAGRGRGLWPPPAGGGQPGAHRAGAGRPARLLHAAAPLRAGEAHL